VSKHEVESKYTNRNKLDFYELKDQLSFKVCIYDVNRVGQISNYGVQVNDSSVARRH